MLTVLARQRWFRAIWKWAGVGSPSVRTRYDIWERPQYAYGVRTAAMQAKRLGFSEMAVIEFGVGGGNGLLALEAVSKAIGDEIGLRIDVFGFDTGVGMPEPQDYRDLPFVWSAGFYGMDRPLLEARLSSAKLVLGDVRETVGTFAPQPGTAPLGFVAFDLDYYSSTRSAFGIFRQPPRSRLPRVHCYFDDVIFPELAAHNEFVGELAAIRDFNDSNAEMKIAKVNGLPWLRIVPAPWNDQIYVLHDFAHPLYANLLTEEGDSYRQLPLR